MAGLGGVRPGAGRKPKADRYRANIRAYEDRIAERLAKRADGLPSILDYIFELAEGVTVQEVTANGEERIYTRAPDLKALMYLCDRIMGKPIAEVPEEPEAATTTRKVQRASRDQLMGLLADVVESMIEEDESEAETPEATSEPV